MTENDNDQRPEDVTGERTCAFRGDFTNEQDAAATAAAEGQLLGAEALPQSSALLVVKRGPNASSCSTRPPRRPVVTRIAISSSMTSPSAAARPVPVRKRRIPGCRRRQPKRHLRQP